MLPRCTRTVRPGALQTHLVRYASNGNVLSRLGSKNRSVNSRFARKDSPQPPAPETENSNQGSGKPSRAKTQSLRSQQLPSRPKKPLSDEPIIEAAPVIVEKPKPVPKYAQKSAFKKDHKEMMPEKPKKTKKGKKQDAMPSGIDFEDDSRMQRRPKVKLPEFISVTELAQAVKIRLQALQAEMKIMGFEDTHHDHVIDGETAVLIAEELGWDASIQKKKSSRTSSDTGEASKEEESIDLVSSPIPADAPLRPPIVTIMGHVDHGKTTILDYLRKSSVAASEHGGITQHIGAFSVSLSSGRQICFLDTPGHAAFLNMRQRGADVTDIVVLVVAADDSVMPQTKEAIKHARNSNVPVIVAVNKIDRPDANVDKVVGDLAAAGVDVEPYGGETQVIPVSGLTGQGIDKLEEAILTLSEILELKAPADGRTEGCVIESQMKTGLGPVATVLVQRGTLRKKSFIIAGTKYCKVRSLYNHAAKSVNEAGPSVPVEVHGWKELPEAGDKVFAADSEAHAKQVIQYRVQQLEKTKQSEQIQVMNEQKKKLRQEQEKEAERQELAKMGLGDELEEESEPSGPKKVSFIVKADVAGSAEAVAEAISAIGNNEIQASVLYSGVGEVTLSDVSRAETANAYILTFNTKIPKSALVDAARRKVEVISHNIIYHLLEDVTKRMTDHLEPEIKHKVLSEAEIKDVFEITVKKSKKLYVAGVRISNGVMTRNAKVKVLRNKQEVYRGTFTSMKHHKDEVSEAKKDSECGISFDNWDKFQPGDVIQSYEEITVQRYL
uniref:Translation initiation factor IF-2, mitochondrial n=1 Tax=Blastobotrys adeninivorans TaxID=409370 RepID=A0A060T7N8_BLAAD